MDKGAAKEKDEPKFFPGWLKSASNGGSSGGANAIHHSASSSHLDERGGGISMRIRDSSSPFDCNGLHSSSKSSSSFRRSSSSSASLSYDRGVSGHSKVFRNSGWGSRGRDWERDRDPPRDRDRTFFVDNFDSLSVSRNGIDSLRRSQTVISRKPDDPLPKRLGHHSANGILRSTGVGGIIKASFESEFPSLGADGKLKPSEGGKISSFGPGSAVQSVFVSSTSATIADGCSALAEGPFSLGSKPTFSSGLPTVALTPTPTSPSCTSSGLNMAETVAQAPSRVHAIPQVSVESQRIEELNRRQCVKLIPLTPSMPKNPASNSEKSKLKGRGGDLAPKASPSGNFQAFNRERNGVSLAAKDVQSTYNQNRTVNPNGGTFPPAVAIPQADGKGQQAPPRVLGSSAVKKAVATYAKNRSDFFNALRKRSGGDHMNGAAASEALREKSGEVVPEVCASVYPEKVWPTLTPEPECALENSDRANGGCFSEDDSCSVTDAVDPEEKAFLESLGWSEDSEGVAALTASEVAEFMEENRERMPSSKLTHLQRIACITFGLASLGGGHES